MCGRQPAPNGGAAAARNQPHTRRLWDNNLAPPSAPLQAFIHAVRAFTFTPEVPSFLNCGCGPGAASRLAPMGAVPHLHLVVPLTPLCTLLGCAVYMLCSSPRFSSRKTVQPAHVPLAIDAPYLTNNPTLSVWERELGEEKCIRRETRIALDLEEMGTDEAPAQTVSAEPLQWHHPCTAVVAVTLVTTP
jgi:hypothetical protein